MEEIEHHTLLSIYEWSDTHTGVKTHTHTDDESSPGTHQNYRLFSFSTGLYRMQTYTYTTIKIKKRQVSNFLRYRRSKINGHANININDLINLINNK